MAVSFVLNDEIIILYFSIDLCLSQPQVYVEEEEYSSGVNKEVSVAGSSVLTGGWEILRLALCIR